MRFTKKTRTVYTQRGELARLHYVVFQQDGQYGLEIQIQRKSGTESARFSAVTASRQKAAELPKLLIENLVTPVTLRVVLEDYLS